MRRATGRAYTHSRSISMMVDCSWIVRGFCIIFLGSLRGHMWVAVWGAPTVRGSVRSHTKGLSRVFNLPARLSRVRSAVSLCKGDYYRILAAMGRRDPRIMRCHRTCVSVIVLECNTALRHWNDGLHILLRKSNKKTVFLLLLWTILIATAQSNCILQRFCPTFTSRIQQHMWYAERHQAICFCY